MEKQFWVYIISNGKNGTLYIGVTSDLARRVHEHKTHLVAGFSSKYSLDKLIYCEQYPSIHEAIAREKQLKTWRRQWKLELIEKTNPNWYDLSKDMLV